MKLLTFLTLLPLAYGILCPSHQYWDTELESCQSCTKCRSDQIPVRPCQPHKNTECKMITDIHDFDLPWTSKNHHKTIHFKTVDENDDDDDIFKDIFSKHPENFEKHHKKQKSDKHHKNKKHYSFKQRINDRFLDWDDDDIDFKEKKHKKHFEFLPEIKHHHKNQKHRLSDFENDNDKDLLLDKFSSEQNFIKMDKFLNTDKYRGNKHKKNSHLAHSEDENILQQWLIQSEKQLKLRKDNLLKTLKEENSDSEEEEKKVKLNYPLNNKENDLENTSHRSSSHKEKSPKHFSELDEQMLQELIKNDETKEMDISSLLSNKRNPFGYRSVLPSHRLFLGEPSTISEIIGQVKDPQEVMKEEMGRNIIYEKSKFSVVPLIKDKDDVVSVPFTAAERFVWDWQAVALISAVLACLVFFMVVAVYSVINARQWKRIKRNYNTEIEEMSTRIALMQQPSLDTGVAECNIGPSAYVVENCPKVFQKH